MEALIEETFDLVERHLPEIDVAGLREVFRTGRSPIDEPPGPTAVTAADDHRRRPSDRHR